MIINNNFEFIFVHIPKNAGTSVTQLFSSFSSYSDIEVGASALGEAIQPFFRARYGLSKHASAREIRAVIGVPMWERYLSFAFVRNPYERTESVYRFFKDTWATKKMPALAAMEQFSNLSSFVASEFFQTEGMDRILNPQLFWLRREMKTEELLVDFVGRVESIQESIEAIFSVLPRLKMKAKAAGKIGTSNASVHKKEDVYEVMRSDPRIESLIYQRYECDFRVFEYPRFVVAPLDARAAEQRIL